MNDYHHGDLRRALLTAARATLDAGGALSLRGVAREAGVSQAAPYRHFADKQALLAAVAEEGFVALRESMAESLALEPVELRIRKLGAAYVRFAVHHPGWFRVMFGDQLDRSAHPGCEAAAKAAFAVLAGAVSEAVESGRMEGDPRDLTLMAWSLVHGMSYLMLDGQGREAGLDPERVDEVAERISRAAMSGLTKT